MLLTELQSLLDKLALPCTFDELMIQCELNSIDYDIVLELRERFQEEYQDGELLDENSFEELENYFDDEFYKQDD